MSKRTSIVFGFFLISLIKNIISVENDTKVTEEDGGDNEEIVTKYIPTNTSYYNKDRKQEPYPEPDELGDCGAWVKIDNVCCARYCDNFESTEDCEQCGGNEGEHCKVPDSFECRSGTWGNDFGEIPNEFHYGRSTHFGLTTGGACGFGLYGVCNNDLKDMGPLCDAFCKSYPSLCKDPEGYTWRGNFAAPPGNYYSQFWGSLEGDRDNYLSCGECFEVYKTKEDGTDYEPGEEGYTPPIILSLIDSCPCSANAKWCCGQWDQCHEVKNFKYGCPLPEGSIHLDLSDIAMARLQNGDANGGMVEGIIPNKYRRIPCPVVGNIYLWLRMGSGEYWFWFSIVNTAGNGALAIVEVKNAEGKWVKMIRDPNYSSSRPQERYGVWATPQNAGPYALPIDVRMTDGSGITLLAKGAIKSFTPPEDADPQFYYIDLGVNFPEIPIPDPPK